MNKTALIWGGIFGLIAPLVGMFVGLQVSSVLGNILMWPFVCIAYMTGLPFGMWGSVMTLTATALSVIVWALIFALAAKLFKR